MKLRALTRYSYGNRALSAGDTFEANDADGALIVQLGNAERVQEPRRQEKPAQPPDQSPAPEQQPDAKPPKKSRKRGYLRRDQRAQD
jgi:hypothetical protein